MTICVVKKTALTYKLYKQVHRYCFLLLFSFSHSFLVIHQVNDNTSIHHLLSISPFLLFKLVYFCNGLPKPHYYMYFILLCILVWPIINAVFLLWPVWPFQNVKFKLTEMFEHTRLLKRQSTITLLLLEKH